MTMTLAVGRDVQAFLASLQGHWTGLYQLWLTPDTPVQECDSSARLALEAGKESWRLAYRWGKNEGDFRLTGSAERAEFSWIDTFHAGSAMPGYGRLSDDGAKLSFMSEYAFEGGQWGWRTEFTRLDDSAFLMEAFNITPDGQEALAVRCRYSRS